jgi:ribosome-interacting GTPase 1
MPTNVTPEYKRAKEAFQQARDPAERLECLKEMLKKVPKHKGTEHLQADIKKRIKQLTDELAAPKKSGARTGAIHSVNPEGAAQVVLIGPPNAGKSTLHARLTGSHAEIAPYPNTTHAPLPGMLPYEDIQIQLVDLPPISATYMEPWMPNALQLAHAALLVIDLGVPGCVENVAAIRERLQEKHVQLDAHWDHPLDPSSSDGVQGASDKAASTSDHDDGEEDIDDPFLIRLPTLLVSNKSDVNRSPEEVEILEDLVGVHYPAIAVSATTGDRLDGIGTSIFNGLGIVRVYTKTPGKPPDKERPYTVFHGGTVEDVARLVHRELLASLKFARIWGGAKFDGQQVGRDHVMCDGDIIELHT